MTFWLKMHWAIWATLGIVVVIGGLSNYLSDTKYVTLELRPRASVDITVFRPFPDKLRLWLGFKRLSSYARRPELGTYQHNRDYETKGYLEFAEPGESIKLLVRGEAGKEVIYEALPYSGYTQTEVLRDLYPFVEDGNPNRFPWPPNLALSQSIPSGNTTFNISVLDVGPQLVGEKVTLIIESPINLKRGSASPGYRFPPVVYVLGFICIYIGCIWNSITMEVYTVYTRQ